MAFLQSISPILLLCKFIPDSGSKKLKALARPGRRKEPGKAGSFKLFTLSFQLLKGVFVTTRKFLSKLN